jgi:arylsulfatase
MTTQPQSPVWPKNPEAPKEAPNVLLIMTDDVGFSAASTFGGAIPTPAFDQLAQNGLRYSQFNTEGICSPTRASLLTGRTGHNVNLGMITNFATGFPGYNGVIPKSAASVAEVLKEGGFSTAAFGKWHLTPDWEESEIGPFDRWPTGMGFEYFYGFLNGDTSQWAPSLVENTTFVEPPADDPNYILDKDLADHAIGWLDKQNAIAPDKPFFMYYAPGTGHTPHHAPKEWLEKFRGKFDKGWDQLRQETFERQKKLGIIPADAKLTPRPDFLPAWDSLTADRKRVYARLFEAFAAELSFCDNQIKRVVDHLGATGQLNNTLVIYIQGDNGSSAEGGEQGLLYEQSFLNRYKESFDYVLSRIDEIGGPNLYQHFPAAWAWATNTPFQYFKQVSSHFGAVRNGMVISWPAQIQKTGTLREQFLHVSDVMPTILDATGVAMPGNVNGAEQIPLDGISFRYTFDQPKTASKRETQLFEVGQNFGIYHDGWWAGSTPSKMPWDMTKPGNAPLEERKWELYNVQKDFSQSHDLSASDPAKLREMQDLFWSKAAQGHILPLHDQSIGGVGRPSLGDARREFTYAAGTRRIPHDAAPPVVGRSFRITADIVVPEGGAKGVMVAQGGRYGGYSFYLDEGRPTFHYNALGERQYTIRTSEALKPGPHKLVANFAADNTQPGAGGELSIAADGADVGHGRIENTLRLWISHSEGLDVGKDTLTPVTESYTVGNSGFTGVIRSIKFNLNN